MEKPIVDSGISSPRRRSIVESGTGSAGDAGELESLKLGVALPVADAKSCGGRSRVQLRDDFKCGDEWTLSLP